MPPTRSTTSRSGSPTPTSTTRRSPSGTRAATPTTSTCVRRSRRSRRRPTTRPPSSTSTSSTSTGGDVNQLGQQAASAFLLWATAAKACGSTLTSDCVMDEAGQGHELDRRRPPRRDQPGANLPPDCGLVLKLERHRVRPVLPGGGRHLRLRPGLRRAGHRPGGRPGQPRRQPDLPGRLIQRRS